ncbi:hypothetical protein NKJ23_25455 [Mesorhizobium sp. M0184]
MADPISADLQRSPDRVLDILKLVHQLLAIDEQHSYLLCFFAFDEDLSEPAEPDEVRNSSCVIAVCFVAHGAQTGLEVSAFEPNRRKPAERSSLSGCLGSPWL